MNTLKLPISLDDVLRGKSVEWERLEYKAGWNPEAVLHTISAFANDFHNLGGGYIVLGVEEEHGRPVLPPAGLDPESLDVIQKELLNLGHTAMQPMYHPLTAPYQVDGRWILVIWVPGGESRPYKTRISLGRQDWAYYIRKQSSTVRCKGADEQELIGLAATVPYDDRYNQRAAVADLSLRLVEGFLKEVGSELAEEAELLSPEVLGRQMNIVGGPSEALFPKNVGLLFFNDDPRRFFPATQIDVVWFPDGAGGDRFEEKTFSGPLSRMTREALDFIQRNYLKETVIKHDDRAEVERIWNFPYAAVEEALVNAVYHRSYEIREPVEVRITPHELLVLSFPGPDRSIRMEDLQEGRAVSRRYRNRRIGEFLKELDLTEGRSTGIPKMLRSMRGNGSPVPAFETDDDRTFCLVRLPVHPLVEGLPQSASQLFDSGAQLPTQPGDVVQRLLFALKDGDLPPKVLRLQLGLSRRATFRDSYLLPALEAGLIEPTIPDKPTSRLQRYRLTEMGLRQLEYQTNSGSEGSGEHVATYQSPYQLPYQSPTQLASSREHVVDGEKDAEEQKEMNCGGFGLAPDQSMETHQVNQQVEQKTQQVTQQVGMLLTIFDGAMSRSALMQVLDLKDRVNFKRIYLDPALADGLIEMTIPDKPNSRLQKYRLTEKGRRVLGDIT